MALTSRRLNRFHTGGFSSVPDITPVGVPNSLYHLIFVSSARREDPAKWTALE